MYLVDHENNIAQLLDFFNEAFHAALKLASELGAGYKGGEVEQVNLLILQLIGNLALHNLHGKALGNGGLAYAGLADETGVVLLSAV
ncbi:hypothetical protein SDC9_129925 [bioreactor metagenome]|uniref:Uncharacterized protein n=1 Tax=bioreactor metagenome TaxID=1076179 RepID=A0A645D198_9ZZZZ